MNPTADQAQEARGPPYEGSACSHEDEWVAEASE